MQKISLTQGQFALVDDSDYEFLSQWKWYALKMRGHFYAVRSFYKGINERGTIKMSRQILGLERGDPRQADHRDHNTLNNSRDNIRICTRSQNQKNRETFSNSTSRFKGVCWDRDRKKWHAQIVTNGKTKHLGHFVKEELAALAYDFAAMKYHREFAFFNF